MRDLSGRQRIKPSSSSVGRDDYHGIGWGGVGEFRLRVRASHGVDPAAPGRLEGFQEVGEAGGGFVAGGEDEDRWCGNGLQHGGTGGVHRWLRIWELKRSCR